MEFKMQQPDQYLKHPDLSTSHHSSRTFTGCLAIGESCTRLLHCHTSLSDSGPQYLYDLTHVHTPARFLRSSSDTCILSTPNVILKSYGPTTWNSLPLALRHQQESDCFNELWKLICFLWINVSIIFSMLLCYYVLLLCYCILLFMFFGLCFVRFMGHVGACSTKLSWDVLPDMLYV